MSRKRKRLTEKECAILRNNPNVKIAVPGRISFTFEFRKVLYEYWESHGKTNESILECMAENGFDISMFRGTYFICNISKGFRHNGFPKGARNTIPRQTQRFRSNDADNAYLISTGRFVVGKNGAGIIFSPDFEEELRNAYPGQSIEQGLMNAGIDPAMVGPRRIYDLKRKFEGNIITIGISAVHSPEEIAEYGSHPYVKRITPKRISLTPAFYNDAHCFAESMPIDEILQVFELDPKLFSYSARRNIHYRLIRWEKDESMFYEDSDQYHRILRNVVDALDKIVEQDLRELHGVIPGLRKSEKKHLCELLDCLIPDPGRKFTKRYILSLLGISKSAYYACLKKPDYGMHADVKDLQDDKDVKVIQEVIDYKGYPKGTRMIYMMMKNITGKQFGINKIRRLKRKYGIICPVRQANVNRRAAQELLKKNRKENLLKRTFRLHRPREVYLSDVTYLDYGNHKRAYGSAIRDAVTGKTVCFQISEHNDLKLAYDTLEWLGTERPQGDPMFHTDQGSLYLSDSFQVRLAGMGFVQSMSKRGNCWDNAPQESFFGHFKDEVDYSGCKTVEELDLLVYDYMRYYNRERCQWTRNRMTPVEYEKYLDSMNEGEFALYMETETAKYERMKARAAEKKKEHIKTLGV